jgi:ATP-binding cassette subfamily F protein 3
VPGVAVAAPPAIAQPAAKPAAAPSPTRSREDRKAKDQARSRLADQTRPLRNEIKQIDDRLARLTKEKVNVEALLASPNLDASAYAEHGRSLAHIQAETAQLEERWLALQGELEAMQAAAS